MEPETDIVGSLFLEMFLTEPVQPCGPALDELFQSFHITTG